LFTQVAEMVPAEILADNILVMTC